VRKFFGWACLGAALVNGSGLSYAGGSLADGSLVDAQNVAALTGGDVTHDSSLAETLNDSSFELCGHGSDSCECSDLCSSSGACLGSWLDNTVVFTGADAYKSIGERITNINGGTGALTGSFGGVTGFNTGFALGDSSLRGQVGASYGVYDLRGRIRLVPEDTTTEEQGFFTTGVYKRGDASSGDPLSYGMVVDAFATDDWGVNANSIDLGQVRGIMGYALSERFEVGGFGTADIWDDQAAVTVAGAPGVRRTVRAAKQFNGYLRGNTPFGGSLMGYAGLFDGADIQAWQFGATGDAPLSNWFSLYGNFNYAVPSASAGPAGSGEEQFAVQFGVAYYFGGKAVSPTVTGQKGLPLLDVANNSSFLITD
jgi:hypothetical protein